MLIYIKNITIYQKIKHKKGFAFIEFDSYKTAKEVIELYDNKIIGDLELSITWPKQNLKEIKEYEINKKEEEENSNTIYSVSYII